MNNQEKELPSWIMKSFADFIASSAIILQFFQLSQLGLSALNIDEIKTFLDREIFNPFHILSEHYRTENIPDILKNFSTTSLEAQIEHDFPLINNGTLLFLWAMLENFISSFILVWLENQPSSINIDAIDNTIKIKLAEYLQLERKELNIRLINRLEINAKNKKGIDRFEELLKIINLSGKVDKKIKDTIFEMQQVRNALAHGESIVSGKLVKNCPNFPLKQGDNLFISTSLLLTYFISIVDYFFCVVARATKYFSEQSTNDQ